MKTDFVQLNNQLYEIDIRLSNAETDLRIPVGAVQDLVIVDSIYTSFAYAILTINSTGNSLDNLVASERDVVRNVVEKTTFSFNTDGRDSFYISIVPKSTTGYDFDKSIWGFNHDGEMASPFIIYDEEEILDNQGQVKSKVFYLKSELQQLLEELNISWSTANVVMSKYANKINVNHVSNSLRKAYTGDCIQHLIDNSAGLNHRGHSYEYSDNWDRGATKAFYTSGPQTTAMEDLQALLDKHVSTISDDFCIFTEERNGKLSLTPMSTIYSKAYKEDFTQLGEYFVDAFSTHGGSMDVDAAGGITRTVPSKIYGFSETESNDLEGLVNFSYLNIANTDSQNELITTMVHSYNHNEKQFSIDCKDNHIYNIKKRMGDLYTSKMKGTGKSTVLPLNNSKVDNSITKHIFSGGGTRQERLPAGINRVIRKSFAFGPNISFDIKGSTARRSGRFMIMNANYANVDAPFAKVFVGEWLVTKVAHYFSFVKNQYINTVSCVKTHSNRPLSDGKITEMTKLMYDQLVEETNASRETN